MVKVIGLTGGIGSGKTYVACLFEQKGLPIYYTDTEAKKISENEDVLTEIRSVFGNGVFENEVLDREKLGSIVFRDANKLNQLNGIIHPAVGAHFEMWKKRQTSDYVLKETAILFETNSAKDCDLVITVEAPMNVRINRVMDRDSLSKEEVENRIANQISDEERRSKSDYVIHNVDKEETQEQVDRVWGLIKS